MNTNTLQESYDVIRNGIGDAVPRHIAILGSGWSRAFDGVERVCELPYDRIPLLSTPSIQGHSGVLLLVRRNGADSLVFCGRKHRYEGCGWEPIAFPVYTAVRMGVSSLLLTNAAGGIRPDLIPGSAMVLSDHLNLMGDSPLAGVHDPLWGARFPDMTGIYDPVLRARLGACLAGAGQPFSEGVYAAVAGPSYETPAEVRALMRMGADAVGMSTVPEAILARAAGLRVAAVSLISNRAAGLATGAVLSHEEVLQTAATAFERMRKALLTFLDGPQSPVSQP